MSSCYLARFSFLFHLYGLLAQVQLQCRIYVIQICDHLILYSPLEKLVGMDLKSYVFIIFCKLKMYLPFMLIFIEDQLNHIILSCQQTTCLFFLFFFLKKFMSNIWLRLFLVSNLFNIFARLFTSVLSISIMIVKIVKLISKN